MGVLSAALFILMGIAVQRLVLDPAGFVRDNALIICENDSKIFLLRDGVRHVLPDLDTAQQIGLKLDNLVQVSCAFSEQFPEGEPVLSLPEFVEQVGIIDSSPGETVEAPLEMA